MNLHHASNNNVSHGELKVCTVTCPEEHIVLGRYQTAGVIGRPLRPGTTPPATTSTATLCGVGERQEDSTRGERLTASGTGATSATSSVVVLLLPPPRPCWAHCTKSFPHRNFPVTGLLRLHASNVAAGSLAA